MKKTLIELSKMTENVEFKSRFFIKKTFFFFLNTFKTKIRLTNLANIENK